MVKKRGSMAKYRNLLQFQWLNSYLAATFCQTLGHPGRRHGCSVQQVQGLECPGHWAECSAALILQTPFERSMPVPGQPSPLDLYNARKYMHIFKKNTPIQKVLKVYLQRPFAQWVGVQRLPADAHFLFEKNKTKHFLVHVHQSLTWILLVLERLHPLLLAQRPLRPGLSSLVPHHSPLDSHLKHPGQLELDFNLEPQHIFCKHEKSGGRLCAITLHLCLVYLTRKSERQLRHEC